MARRATLNAVIVAVALAALERRALASPLPESLSFEFSACPAPELDAASLAEAVRSELEADGVGRVLAPSVAESEGSLSVRVECDATLTTRVTLKANRTGREQHEQFALGDAAPSARARALALALAELVRADWPALSSAPSARSDARAESHAEPATAAKGEKQASKAAPPVKPATTPATSPDVEPVEDRPARGPARRAAVLTWAGGARLHWFVDYQSVSLGGDLGVDFKALRIRAEVLAASTSDTLGSAALGSAAFCVGYRLFDWQLGPLNLFAYPMASAGLTWLRGSSSQPSTRVDPATGFYGDARLVLEAGFPRWTLAPTLAVEAGRATGFVARAGDRTLGATGGFFMGASIGARY